MGKQCENEFTEYTNGYGKIVENSIQILQIFPKFQ